LPSNGDTIYEDMFRKGIVRKSLLLLSMIVTALNAFPTAGVLAQAGKAEQAKVSPELQARIRQLIALFGPDPTRGTCMPNPYLPTNQAKLELIAIGKPATLPLCAVLEEKDKWRRIMAVEALREIRDRRAVRPLLQTLQRDTNDNVQGKAAEALGEIGDPLAIEALLDALKVRNRDPKNSYPAYVAAQSALALGKLGDKRAIPALLPLVGSREGAASSFFIIPLGTMVAEALGKLGSEASQPLMGLLRHANRDVRCDAAQALGAMKARQAVPHLLSLLTPSIEDLEEDVSYEDFKVSVETIKALGEIGDRRATRPLLKNVNIKRLLGEANQESSVVVIEALGKVGDPLAVETLIQLLPSKDSYVRRRTLEALWRIKTPTVVEPLLKALQEDEDSRLRYDAAEWLGMMQEQSALPALNKALSDEDDNVRDSAAVAIGRIDSDHLLALLNDKDENVRRAVVHGLGVIGCKQAVPRLLALIRDEELGYRAMDALGKLGTPELLPRLESLMHDPDYPHRATVRYTIMDIKKRYKL
jgi:HEAT repeat protein